MSELCSKFLEIKNYIPKNTEDPRIKFDEKIIFFNTYFNAMRCLEYSNPNTEEVTDKQYLQFKKMFSKMYYELHFKDKDNFAVFTEFFKELYLRSIYYYSYLNNFFKIGNIRVYNYVKNNDCLIPLLNSRIKKDLLHFDTHSDHKEFENFDQYKKILEEPNIDINKVIPETYDIGCFSSYYILYSKTNFIWITPDWCFESKKFSKRRQKMIRDPKKNEVKYVKADISDPDSYLNVCGKLKNDDFEKLTEHLGNDFILSIDLDYFCTNGLLAQDFLEFNDKTSEYLKEADPASFGRTRMFTEGAFPYFNYEDTELDDTSLKDSINFTKYTKNLITELELIKFRIETFSKFLLYIRDIKNIKPSMIVVSDSANVGLSRSVNNITMTNDFCPQNLVLFIRHELYQKLQDIYENNQFILNKNSKFFELPDYF